MGLNARRTTRMVLALLGLVLAAATYDGVQVLRDERWNRAIAGGQALPNGDVPELRFARAHALAASGAAETALDQYRPLQGESALGQAARFNSANLLLRQAIGLREGSQPGQAVPLIELAKETYREVLRHDPDHWNARYNLERAQRLLPDPEDNGDSPPPPSQAERAATTMRGYSPGLP